MELLDKKFKTKLLEEDIQKAQHNKKKEKTKKAVWTTAYINNLPDSAFAIVLTGGKKDQGNKTVPRSLRKLPYKDANGKVDLPHLRNALARLPQSDLTAAQKKSALKVLQAAAKKVGVGAAAKKDANVKKGMGIELGALVGVDYEKVSKQGDWFLRNKYIRIETAENGLILDISEDWEIAETEDSRRDYKWISRRYIFATMEGLVEKLMEELTYLTGSTMTVEEFAEMHGYMPRKKEEDTDLKVASIRKGMMVLKTGEADGHIHTAHGEIVDKEIQGVMKKFFVGETKEEATYYLIEGIASDIVSTTYDEVTSLIKSHSHKFEIELTEFDETGWRVKGETSQDEQHYHHVDIVNFESVPMSNTPDE